ncbi:hypothetical protein [Tatumella terrea]|uniref:hypothetical protein n=1 Tax=Tatumella terrea TaxID=419007 RepID=UPI0031E08768
MQRDPRIVRTCGRTSTSPFCYPRLSALLKRQQLVAALCRMPSQPEPPGTTLCEAKPYDRQKSALTPGKRLRQHPFSVALCFGLA